MKTEQQSIFSIKQLLRVVTLLALLLALCGPLIRIMGWQELVRLTGFVLGTWLVVCGIVVAPLWYVCYLVSRRQ